MEIVTFKTSDGLEIASWYAAASDGYPTVIYFPGVRGHLGLASEKAREFLDKGYGVLMAGYRGYGINPGRTTENGLYKDARAGFRFLESRGIPQEQVILYGYSLGTALAIQLGTEKDVAGLILEAPFMSSRALARQYVFFTPSFLIRDKFDSLGKIGQIERPILIVHGAEDRLAPLRHAMSLCRAAPNAALEVVENTGHRQVFERGMDKFFRFTASIHNGTEMPFIASREQPCLA